MTAVQAETRRLQAMGRADLILPVLQNPVAMAISRIAHARATELQEGELQECVMPECENILTDDEKNEHRLDGICWACYKKGWEEAE